MKYWCQWWVIFVGNVGVDVVVVQFKEFGCYCGQWGWALCIDGVGQVGGLCQQYQCVVVGVVVGVLMCDEDVVDVFEFEVCCYVLVCDIVFVIDYV